MEREEEFPKWGSFTGVHDERSMSARLAVVAVVLWTVAVCAEDFIG